MKIALCYESVFPARGGCETYIADLARRLVRDGHEVHLYACAWDAEALPEAVHFHHLQPPRGPRWLRPWRFGAACARALRGSDAVSVGFNKTWGQDVLYPQGGLHAASAEHNLRKYSRPQVRRWARRLKYLDVAHWSFTLLERRQYLARRRPLIVVNSEMVRDHFRLYLGLDAEALRVVHSAIDPDRMRETDRLRRRLEWRQFWGIEPGEHVALFVAMNYRLKGLRPLLHALARVPCRPLRLLVAGHPNTKPYERLARRLGVEPRVRFAGPVREVKNCFFASDFLVHPTFYDPCSLVVLEALACGLPVITTRYNGAAELLSPPREGFVIADPHDHEELADRMAALLDPGRRTACAQEARRAAARWTFDDHYRKMLAVLAEAAARKKAA